jgi:hypothetical protein
MREERYVVATPVWMLPGFASEGALSTLYVKAARLGLLSEEEEMEYCLGRMGGSKDKKVPKGSDTDGNRSRRSRMDARLRLISSA